MCGVEALDKMKCEICKCKTHVIHINEKHEKVCSGCSMKFINPTGGKIRNDKGGLGHHGAPRGSRKHDGVDFSCVEGQDVLMPVDGIISRESLPYHDDLRWRGVQVVSQRIEIKMWYLKPFPDVIGLKLKAGTPIGKAQNIGTKNGYGYVTPHIHLRIIKCDPMLLFT